MNEFGAQALPSLESMRKILHEKKLWPPDWEAWAYHDFQYDQTFRVAQIEMGDSLEGLIQNSQEYQYRLLKFAIESYRRDRRMTGLFQFMFMDPWPAITWSVVDYWRQLSGDIGHYRWLFNQCSLFLPMARIVSSREAARHLSFMRSPLSTISTRRSLEPSCSSSWKGHKESW